MWCVLIFSPTLLAAQEKEVFFLGRFSWLHRNLGSGEGEGLASGGSGFRSHWNGWKQVVLSAARMQSQTQTRSFHLTPTLPYYAFPPQPPTPIPMLLLPKLPTPFPMSPSQQPPPSSSCSPSHFPHPHPHAPHPHVSHIFCLAFTDFSLTFTNFVILPGKSHAHPSQSHPFLYFSPSSSWLLSTQKIDFPWPVQTFWLHLTFIWLFLTNVLFFLTFTDFSFFTVHHGRGCEWAFQLVMWNFALSAILCCCHCDYHCCHCPCWDIK